MTFRQAISTEKRVAIFTMSYLGIAAVFSWYLGNEEFLFYVFVVLVIGMTVLAVHQYVQFTRGVLWMLSVWGLFHVLGGLVPLPSSLPLDGDKHVLYSLWLIPNFLKYDHIMHTYGFAISTWACWQVLRPLISNPKGHPAELVISVFAANGLGALNEIVEFFAVLTLPETNVGGYMNTGWDLVANFVGSMIAVAVIRYGRPVTFDAAEGRK